MRQDLAEVAQIESASAISTSSFARSRLSRTAILSLALAASTAALASSSAWYSGRASIRLVRCSMTALTPARACSTSPSSRWISLIC